ncbi:MAG TPA: hypothetical protein VLD62_09945, partial [Acidimicrobiia bacterium]|nr:hypothetical protein [Acidimicrobiia bacterium]
PDKAIDLIDEAASRKRALEEARVGLEGVAGGEDLSGLEVTADEVIAVLEDWIGGEDETWSQAVYGSPEAGPAHG